MATPSTLLVWRSSQASRLPQDNWAICPFCSTSMIFRYAHNLGSRVTRVGDCPFCGWRSIENWAQEFTLTGGETRDWCKALAEFDVNSPQVALSELGTYLKRNVADVYALNWRRFEEIVEDVFSRNGLRTYLTQATRDNAADILIVGESDRVETIVECKRIDRERKIDVNVIRILIGAAVDWEVKHVCLVTTGGLTAPAASRVASYRDKGYIFDVIKAQELLTLLDVYNGSLPSWPKLDDETKAQIIQQNVDILRNEERSGWPNGTPSLF